MIGVVLLFTTMSYILIFPTVIKLRYIAPERRTAVQDPVRDGRRLVLRRDLYGLGRVRLDRRDLPGSRQRAVPERSGPRRRLWPLARRLHVDRGRGDRRHVARRRVFYWAGAKTRAEMVPNTLPPEITGEAQVAPSHPRADVMPYGGRGAQVAPASVRRRSRRAAAGSRCAGAPRESRGCRAGSRIVEPSRRSSRAMLAGCTLTPSQAIRKARPSRSSACGRMRAAMPSTPRARRLDALGDEDETAECASELVAVRGARHAIGRTGDLGDLVRGALADEARDERAALAPGDRRDEEPGQAGRARGQRDLLVARAARVRGRRRAP